jgi:hypothetical protein
MRTSNELYKAHKEIINECKANICREIERIGRTELWFDYPFSVLADYCWGYESGATAERIASISINESGQLLYLRTEEETEIDPADVVASEWLYIWERVEEECKELPTAYYTETAHHDKKNNRLIYELGENIEETKVEGEQEAKEQLIYNYQQFIIDNAPLDYLPIFFLCVRINGEYKRKYAILSNSVAEGMEYTPNELHNLRKSLNHPVICA